MHELFSLPVLAGFSIGVGGFFFSRRLGVISLLLLPLLMVLTMVLTRVFTMVLLVLVLLLLVVVLPMTTIRMVMMMKRRMIMKITSNLPPLFAISDTSEGF